MGTRALQPMQPPKASQNQFLKPLARMQSLMKEGKMESAMRQAIPVAGLLAPSVAHAAEPFAYSRTQSLDYLINSLHWGGLLVIVIAAALLTVADIDPVSRG